MADKAQTPPAADNADPFSEDQAGHLDDVFGFGEADDIQRPANDAETPSSEEGSDAPEADASVGAEAGEEEGAGQSSSSEPAKEKKPAPEPATDAELELQSLKATVARLTAEIEKPATKEEKPAAEEPAAEDKPPEAVAINLPPEYTDAIFGEDADPKAVAAMNGIVSGIVNTMRTSIYDLNKHWEKKFAEAGKAPPAAKTASEPSADADADGKTAAARMREEYFGDFPEHNKPEILPIVQAVAVEMAQQFPGAAWDVKYRASLGTRVAERLKALAALANGGRKPSNSSLASLPAGSRSADPAPGDQDISDEILDTLGFG